ncbi:tetratricopeptide repeat protein [Demequina aurantiaca]|uniref:tetratricopeptide repeat protein n=1 Tax=Demequina aurantiaca TaxID=676200 RepID=UPI003D358080
MSRNTGANDRGNTSRGATGGYQGKPENSRGGAGNTGGSGYQGRPSNERTNDSRNDSRGTQGGYQGRPENARGATDRPAKSGYQGNPANARGGSGSAGGYQGRPENSRGGAGSTGGYQGRPENARGSSADRPAKSGYQGNPANARGAAGGPAKSGYQGNPANARGAAPRSGYLGKGGASNVEEDRPARNEGLVRKTPIVAPEIPDEVTFDLLDKPARARLRTLSKDNAEDVARHLIMAGRLIDIDPERAYQHAQVAVARGGRVDIVREAAALTAYASGHYADALREFRTVRRLNGSSEHLPLMADCERGLGRPERAIALAQEPEAKTLDPDTTIELQIVIAGARTDMGNLEAALLTLNRLTTKNPESQNRINEAKITILHKLGRDKEANTLQNTTTPTTNNDDPTWADEIYLYDTEELPEPEEPELALDSDPGADVDPVVDGGDEEKADGDVVLDAEETGAVVADVEGVDETPVENAEPRD